MSNKTEAITDNHVKQLKEMLFNIINLFQKYKIDYWLDFGTLLGAVRDKKIIEWDEDIDISIWEKDKYKIKLLEKDFLNLGYDVDNDNYRCKVWYSVNNHNIWADIYIWRKGNKIYKNIDPSFDCRINKFSLNILGDFDKINLYGKDFTIPENSKQKLQLMYGNWKLPIKRKSYWGS